MREGQTDRQRERERERERDEEMKGGRGRKILRLSHFSDAFLDMRC